MTAKKFWLCRGFLFAMMALLWLTYAGLHTGFGDDDLLARGKTTVAKPRKGFDRWLPEGHVIGVEWRVPVLKRKRTYSYEVEGRYYENYTTREKNPVGQTITYLPEDPKVHRLGVIEPWSTATKVCWTLFLAPFLILLTFCFVACCVLSPREDNPTRQGRRIILGLSIAQLALGFTTFALIRLPPPVIFTWYVPAFVGGTIAALLGVRFFAWGWGIRLGEPEPANRHLRAAIRADASRRHKYRGCGERRVQCRTGPRAVTTPGPEQYYYVTSEPGRNFVRTASANEIRDLLAAGELKASFHATESDGRSFAQFQKGGGGGRWRTLAALLAERGETPPPLAPAAAPLPWHVTRRAALAGATACLLLAVAGSLLTHGGAFLCRLAGASWSWVAFFTGPDSILMDLILVTIATTFGAIRGVVHLTGDRPNSKQTYAEIAEKAADDLGRIQDTSGPLADTFERIACLFMAAALASPVIVILLLVWFRS